MPFLNTEDCRLFLDQVDAKNKTYTYTGTTLSLVTYLSWVFYGPHSLCLSFQMLQSLKWFDVYLSPSQLYHSPYRESAFTSETFKNIFP